MEHVVGEIARRDVLRRTQHLSRYFLIDKNVKGGHSAKEPVRKGVGRLGEESSVLRLSWYLLKINFTVTLDLYFASQNAETYGPLNEYSMSHDIDMIEEPDIPTSRFLCRTT